MRVDLQGKAVRHFLLALALLLPALAPSVIHAAKAPAAVLFEWGGKRMSSSDWRDSWQGAQCLSLHARGEGDPAGIQVSWIRNASRTRDGWTEKTSEWAIGAWWPFLRQGPAELYASVGLALLLAETQEDRSHGRNQTRPGSGLGPWLELGCDLGLPGPFLFSGSLHWSRARVEILDWHGDAGGWVLKAGVGFLWE